MTTLNQLHQTAAAITAEMTKEAFTTFRERSILRQLCLFTAARKFEAWEMEPEADALKQLADHVAVEDATEEEVEATFAEIVKVDEAIYRNFDGDTMVPAFYWLCQVGAAGEAVLEAATTETESRIARLDGNFVVGVTNQIIDTVTA